MYINVLTNNKVIIINSIFIHKFLLETLKNKKMINKMQQKKPLFFSFLFTRLIDNYLKAIILSIQHFFEYFFSNKLDIKIIFIKKLYFFFQLL
jgi:hypothetical protein